jgi:hypothetical protein
MAKPLPAAEGSRNGISGSSHRSTSKSGIRDVAKTNAEPATVEAEPAPEAAGEEIEQLRQENEQLRFLCTELEQALQEATAQHGDQNYEDRIREYEALLEEKTETIRQVHQQLQDAQTMIADLEADRNSKPRAAGPTPREDELLNLSEELERERRQLQEDEETLMQQMREMEMTMARERAEMARQRNDLQRIQGEVRHELERLERNGALQSKIESLKSKLYDATTRRGMASSPGVAPTQQQAAKAPPAPPPVPEPPKREGGSLFGRLFGGGR